MKLPSWNDFTLGLDKFRKQINDKKVSSAKQIQLMDNHIVFDEIIKGAVPLLPSPFNSIVQAIYYSSEGPKKKKVDEVLKFLDEIESQTEEHYKEVTSQLSNALGEISDMKAIVAKEGTLQLIEEILISKDNTINQKLDVLKDELDNIKELHQKLNNLYQSYGLNWLSPDYFEVHKSTDKDLENWKNGFTFNLPSIKEGKELRRNIVEQIKNKLEETYYLLLLGEPGTSKSIILEEIMCDYFDSSYEILYNYGDTEIRNGNQLVDIIKDLLKDEKRIFVAVDNVHSRITSAIFYVMDNLLSYEKNRNIRFLLTARLPEFDYFTERLNEVEDEGVRQSMIKFMAHTEFRYKLPYFTMEEIKEFFIKYREISISDSDTLLHEIIEKIYSETNGHPTMVKFSVLGKGLAEDVITRYERYT